MNDTTNTNTPADPALPPGTVRTSVGNLQSETAAAAVAAGPEAAHDAMLRTLAMLDEDIKLSKQEANKIAARLDSLHNMRINYMRMLESSARHMQLRDKARAQATEKGRVETQGDTRVVPRITNIYAERFRLRPGEAFRTTDRRIVRLNEVVANTDNAVWLVNEWRGGSWGPPDDTDKLHVDQLLCRELAPREYPAPPGGR